MLVPDHVRTEAAHYRLLADQLRTDYLGIDDETLADTLQGLNDLPELIEEIVRSSLEDQSLVEALKARVGDMSARLDRIKLRFDRKRALACWAMGTAGIDKIQAEDFSVGLREGALKLEVVDEARIPETFLVPQPPKLDRGRITAALKQGEAVEGALLVPGEPHIAVRTR